MRIAHLTASPFFGGPERQMLGLALSLPFDVESRFFSFPERGLCHPFLEELTRHGFHAEALASNSPHYFAVQRELREKLEGQKIDLLCCHGYKAGLLGRPAARRVGIPVVRVSRGWTAATWKVRLYEMLDRINMRFMDRVVCVSEGQAAKVRRAGVPDERVSVIRNSIFTDRFGEPDAQGRAFLQSFFLKPREFLIGAAGRLSPEKGFEHLVDSAAHVVRMQPNAGFLLFGDGPLRAALARQIASRGLRNNFVLADFRADLDRWLPNFDVFSLPSYTEGLPNVVLEAFAARVPVVATAVGGTPEVIEDGLNGFLVPPGQPVPLADGINRLLSNACLRETFGMAGYYRVRDHFTFEAQAQQYVRLFRDLLEGKSRQTHAPHGKPHVVPTRSSRAATGGEK
ncbi:MAG: glycosyltransferase family 4 protein [Planctomycetes bacterium]|nr:glycosyltransferase family 4 protein [Planctomycetota bacterium]